MPQLDFRQLFPSSERKPASPDHPSPDGSENAPSKAQPAEPRARLGLLGWINVMFVALAVLGAVFCAFYFFNGTDLLRTSTAWSHEFLYPRPPAVRDSTDASNGQNAADRTGRPNARSSDIDHDTAAPFNGDIWPKSLSSQKTTEPIDSASGARSLASQTPFASSSFGRLDAPTHGSDSLTRALHQTTPDSASRRRSTASMHKTSVSARKKISRRTKKRAAKRKSVARKIHAASGTTTRRPAQTARQARTNPRSTSGLPGGAKTTNGAGINRAGLGAVPTGFRGFGGNLRGGMGHGGFGGGARGH
jgi:hypothetical protein